MEFKKQLKQYIVAEFLPGQHAVDLPEDLDLLANGILDSLAVLKLVAYIENVYDISLEPEEIDLDNLSSVNAICGVIQRKSKKAA
jgi:acyl carrier protein